MRETCVVALTLDEKIWGDSNSFLADSYKLEFLSLPTGPSPLDLIATLLVHFILFYFNMLKVTNLFIFKLKV